MREIFSFTFSLYEKVLLLCEKSLLEFLSNLYVLRSPESKKTVFIKVFVWLPSVCLPPVRRLFEKDFFRCRWFCYLYHILPTLSLIDTYLQSIQHVNEVTYAEALVLDYEQCTSIFNVNLDETPIFRSGACIQICMEDVKFQEVNIVIDANKCTLL